MRMDKFIKHDEHKKWRTKFKKQLCKSTLYFMTLVRPGVFNLLLSSAIRETVRVLSSYSILLCLGLGEVNFSTLWKDQSKEEENT